MLQECGGLSKIKQQANFQKKYLTSCRCRRIHQTNFAIRVNEQIDSHPRISFAIIRYECKSIDVTWIFWPKSFWNSKKDLICWNIWQTVYSTAGENYISGLNQPTTIHSAIGYILANTTRYIAVLRTTKEKKT